MARKKQGDNSRLDESLGERNKGKKKQSMASRRKESEGTEKSMGRRKFAAVGTMDKGNRKSKAKRVVNLGAGGAVGRSSGSSANSSNTPQHKLMAMGKNVGQGTSPVKMRGGGMAAVKKMSRVKGPVKMRGGGMAAVKKTSRVKGPRGR
jgi:hypothetical protein